MKKTLIIILTALFICLSGCTRQNSAQDKVYRIKIIKQLDHASLNEIADAIEAQLQKAAEEEGIGIEVYVTSGQNDAGILKQLADEAAASHPDAIIPIATLAAQVCVSSTMGTDIPVIFAAISDPEEAGLTGMEKVTGTSDALNTAFIIDMILKQDPDVKKIGLLYSLSEANSTNPIREAKQILEKKGIDCVEAAGNTSEEIISSAGVLIAQGVDAVFTPTDNVVMAAELAIAPMFVENGIPHYAGADSFVRNGAFATCGVNYTDLGTKTADLAFKVIQEGFEGIKDFYLMDGGIITVNRETASALRLDPQIFAEMGQLIVVDTSED